MKRKRGRWFKPRTGGYSAVSNGQLKPPPPVGPGAASHRPPCRDGEVCGEPTNCPPTAVRERKIIDVRGLNSAGEWVPLVPLPYFRLLRKQCVCDRAFWTREGYEGHYALAHILKLGKERL